MGIQHNTFGPGNFMLTKIGTLRESAVYPDSPKSHPHPEVHQAQHCWWGKGRNCAALLCHGVTTPQILCAVRGDRM